MKINMSITDSANHILLDGHTYWWKFTDTNTLEVFNSEGEKIGSAEFNQIDESVFYTYYEAEGTPCGSGRNAYLYHAVFYGEKEHEDVARWLASTYYD